MKRPVAYTRKLVRLDPETNETVAEHEKMIEIAPHMTINETALKALEKRGVRVVAAKG